MTPDEFQEDFDELNFVNDLVNEMFDRAEARGVDEIALVIGIFANFQARYIINCEDDDTSSAQDIFNDAKDLAVILAARARQ